MAVDGERGKGERARSRTITRTDMKSCCRKFENAVELPYFRAAVIGKILPFLFARRPFVLLFFLFVRHSNNFEGKPTTRFEELIPFSWECSPRNLRRRVQFYFPSNRSPCFPRSFHDLQRKPIRLDYVRVRDTSPRKPMVFSDHTIPKIDQLGQTFPR